MSQGQNRHSTVLDVLMTPVLFLALSAAAGAATYQVGPGRSYTKLQDLTSLLKPGDVVEVDGNATYPGDLQFTAPGTAANPITIRGIAVSGKKPLITGGTNTVHFRTDTIGQGADHYVMDGFEITGGSFRCVFHQSDDVTLRNLTVHDCPQHGILGADWGAGSLTVEYTEVYASGSGDRYHQIYASTDEDNYPNAVFRLQHSWIHDATGGNNVKSRAARNEIYYNRIEGAYYHELELVGSECCAESEVREDSDVVGNLFLKKGSNAGFYVVRFGGDGTGQSWGRYRFVNNTVVSGSSSVFRLFDGIGSLEAHNNVFYRSGGPVSLVRTVEAVWSSGQQIVGSNNWLLSGATGVTGTWTGTVAGTNPGFTNAAGGDYSPTSTSPLIDAGTASPSGPPGFAFPNPLFPPAYEPPGTPGVFGSPNVRPADGVIDIGAYEWGTGGAPQLSVTDVSASEGNSGTTNATFTVTLSPASTGTVTVNYATANGTATAGSDYTAVSGTLTFSAGQTSKTVSVPVIGDTVVEPNETFYLLLSGASGATILDNQGQATIVNDDTAPAGTLSINDATVVEGNSGTTSAVFTVSLSAASSQAVTVDYATANGTATAGSDYASAAGSLSFPAGTTTRTIAVAATGDTTVEPDETFFVNLTSPVGATIADAQGVGTITNDDAGTPPAGAQAVVWTSLVGATASGNSLTKTAATGWGNAGAISTQQIASGDGYVEFTASETTTYRMLGLSNGNTNSNWDDIDFALYQYAGQLQVYEAGTARGTFGTYVPGDVLRVAVVGGVVKYSRNGVVFYTSPKTPVYPLLVDTALYSTAATLNNAMILAGSAGPTLSISDVSVVEGNSAPTTARFTVTLSAASTSTVTVNYATADVTATANSDYVAKSGTLSFTAGTTSQFIDVTVNGDTVVEPNETFVVNLTSPVGATIADAQGVGTITNDDGTPGGAQAVVWTSLVGATASGNSLTKTAATGWGNAGAISTQQIASGDGYVEFTASETTTYRMLGLSNGNTNSNWDDIDFSLYEYAGQLQVYEAGTARGTFGTYVPGDILRVAVVGGVVKYSKNGSVFYTSPKAPVYPLLVDTALYSTGATLNNAMILAGSAGPTLSISDVSVVEGNSATTTARFTVTLSAASTSTVTVNYATADATATAGSDYVAKSGTLSFTAGTTSQLIDVTVNGDTVVESNETFVVNLTSPVGATIADAQGVGTITNDDAGTPPAGAQAVAWTSLVGATASGNSLTKTAATGWGNAGAFSTQQIASGDGYVEFTASETTTYRMLGLSNGNTNSNWDDIDFALYEYAGQLQVYEAGTARGTFGTYAAGDILRVAVVGGVVKYSKNGSVFYTSPKTPVYPLLVDTALYSTAGTLNNAMITVP